MSRFNCQELTSVFNSWRALFSEVKELRSEYLENPRQATEEKLRNKINTAKEMRGKYHDITESTAVEWHHSTLPYKDALVLTVATKHLSDIPTLTLKESGHIKSVHYTESDDSAKQIHNFVEYLPYLLDEFKLGLWDTNLKSIPSKLSDKLRSLNCKNSNLQPNGLPDEIIEDINYINIENTPASNDSEVRDKLERISQGLHRNAVNY